MQQIKLTSIDRKILREMLFNGFTSFSALSKRLRLAQSTLQYSIRKMRSEGVIQGYRLRLNPLALGYQYPALLLIEPKLAKHTDHIKDEISKFPWVNAVSVVTGETDIIAFVYFKDRIRMGEAIDQILEEHGDKIRRINTIPIINLLKLHQKPIIRSIPLRLDDVDLAILREHYKNPMLPISEIARTIGRSRNMVSARLRRIYEEQVILKKSVKMDLDYLPKLRISCWSVIFFDVPPENRNMFVRELVNMESVHELSALGTSYDYFAVVRSQNINALSRFVRYLLDRDLVARTRTNVVLMFSEKDIGSYLLGSSQSTHG